LGLTITAAPQLIAQLTQVTLKNAGLLKYIIAVSTVFFHSLCESR
jgi:hypothetical protein